MRRALVALLLAVGCGEPPVTRNFVGRVLAIPYVPETRGSGVGVGVNTGKGGGVVVMPMSTHTAAVYEVVVQGGATRLIFADSALWSAVRVGDSVSVGYIVGPMTVVGWRVHRVGASLSRETPDP